MSSQLTASEVRDVARLLASLDKTQLLYAVWLLRKLAANPQIATRPLAHPK